MKKILVAAALLIASPALAQQQPDAAFLQRALAALQEQRNQAQDQAVIAQARAAGLAEELAKAQAALKALQEEVKEPKK